MKNTLDRYLTVQVDDKLVAQKSRLLLILIILMSLAGLLTLLKDVVFGTTRPDFLAAEIATPALFSILYWYTWRGHRWPSYVFLAFLALVIPFSIRDSLASPLVLAVAIPVVMAPLTTASWSSIPVAAAEGAMLHLLSAAYGHPPVNPVAIVTIGVLGVVSWLSSSSLENALRESRRNASALEDSNRELQSSRALLEASARDLERRSDQLEASAEAGRATTTILETDYLIRQAVELIRDRFGLYYVGLFQVDEAGEWAVLRAGTGEAGQAMLARGHRIRVGEGMIGWSVANAQARVALDVGEDAVRLATTELPDTRSEAALPLRSRGRVIGALTVQSSVPAAFDQDTIVVLQTMADQVAVAIDNAHLFAESQAALAQLQAVQRRYLDRAWREFVAASPVTRVDHVQPGTEGGNGNLLREAQHAAIAFQRTVATGSSASGTVGKPAVPQAALVVPLKLRGQVIGTVTLHEPGQQRLWTTEEIALAENAAEQLALTAENLRLMDETQRRAARERVVGEVTARVRETLDMETVLKTAADEIGRALGLAALDVRLGTEGEGADK